MAEPVLAACGCQECLHSGGEEIYCISDSGGCTFCRDWCRDYDGPGPPPAVTDCWPLPAAGGYDWRPAKTGRSWLAHPPDLLNQNGRPICLQVLAGKHNFAGCWRGTAGEHGAWYNAATPADAAELCLADARRRYRKN